jgi:hypothetical protein
LLEKDGARGVGIPTRGQRLVLDGTKPVLAAVH